MKRFICAITFVLLGTPAAFPEDAVPDRSIHETGQPLPTYLAVIPASANSPGRHGAYYKTRVVMHNVTAHDITVLATLYGPKGVVTRKAIRMTAGSYRVWENFLGEVFNSTGTGACVLLAESALTLDLDEIVEMFSVTAEVYTDSPNGRFTTTVANGLMPLISDETTAVSAGITIDENQRVNLGIFNPDTDAGAAVRAKVYDAGGTMIEEIRFEAGPGEWRQKSIRVPVTNGIIWWEIPKGAAYLWTVAVDNRSNDGTLSYPIRLEGKPETNGVTQKIADIVPSVPSVGPTEAGKQAQDPLVVTVNDDSGGPISGATYQWETDEHSGWVYPSEGITGTDGQISATWIAGSPGAGSLTLTVENAVSALTAEIPTDSVVSPHPPSSAINLFMRSGDSSGYSIDLTPLTEPGGTYYSAIQWDGGYTGLQRAGTRYDRQLQFSVWDAGGIDAQVIERGEKVICSPFGGEGTGQKCELNYPWRIGTTYRFEVTEEDLNGGSVMTLHVTDLASDRRTFVGALRYGHRADLSWMNMFVEDFLHTAPTCLAQPVRSAAIRRAMARIGGSWQPITRGVLNPHAEDAGNPGTPPCANLATRDHAAGLEVVMGGRTAGGPLTVRAVSIP